MAGTAGRGCGVGRSSGVISSVGSMEALTEWRSSEQLENNIPSSSPPYWDMDDEDNCGPKPSELYGKFTWKIENFSQISKRELRSNIFEVGGYKWYILIYPQGCDVCNHLSLFLCVANHDKLSPGWKHFAQFTIAVVNKDPKKSKYSDTLHRFGKKEHDWGWKKFMELSKVLDGFIVSDILVIKAQVQVISEKEACPFRCLDCQYRRELVRVYLTNVEQICRRSLEERRDRLLKLIEDTARWPRFCEFWLEVDDDSRHSMHREKSDVIFKVVVNKFFIEKEVTSTLVMDSLYSGLKALEGQSKSKKGKAKSLVTGETPSPIVRLEKDMFVLADDVLLLLQRAAREPLPPNDEKGPQNRTKDGSSGEDVDKDSMERDERRLTELGRRTVEIFVLEHIFSNKIVVAYEEAAALKRQEELIREEEVAGQADCDKKAKRAATEKEKRAKKKQSKHRRNSRKGKDKGKDDKFDATVEDKQQGDAPNNDITSVDAAIKPVQYVPDKRDTGDDGSDVSDTDDDVSETLQLESEDRDISTVNWDTDTSGVRLTETSGSEISGLPLENGQEEKKSTYIMDDSSSTCSTDSVPSEVMNGLRKGNKLRSSPTRGKSQCGKETENYTTGRACEFYKQPSEPVAVVGCQYGTSQSCTATAPESEAVLSLKDQIKWLQQHLVQKEEEVVTLQKKLDDKDQVDVARPSKQNLAAEGSPFPSGPTKYPPSTVQPKVVYNQIITEPVSIGEKSSNRPQKVDKATSLAILSPQVSSIPKKDVQNPANPSKPTIPHTEKSTDHQAVAVSRPSSARLIPAPGPSAPVVFTVQTAPSLSQSVSAAGRLANVPQSCKNAIIGKTVGGGPVGFTPSMGNPSPICSQAPYILSLPMLSPQSSTSSEQGSDRPGFTIGSVSQKVLHNQPPWIGESSEPGASSINCDSSLSSKTQNVDMYDCASAGSRAYFSDEPSGSSRQAQGMTSVEDFPHLDIINYLLDEEQNMGKAAETNAVFHNPNSGHHHTLNRQYTFPGNMAMSADMGPWINGCRYDRPSSYHDDANHGVYGIPLDVRREVRPQAGLSPYGNGQLEGGLQNQWPMSAAHMRTREGDGYQYQYQYQLPEYANVASGINGYSMYRSSNGL